MIYKNEEIPSSFNKVAEISDNYIVWVDESTLRSGQNYDAYIQFFNPSFYYIFVDDYKIKDGTSYSYDANYQNNGVYSYIESYDKTFSLDTLTVDDDFVSTAQTSRSDCINIYFGQFLCVVTILWIFKQFSRLFFKGGLS